MAELDSVSLRFEPDETLGHLAIMPVEGHGSIDPEAHVLPLAGDLKGIPLAGRLYAAIVHLLGEVDPLDFTVDRRVAENVSPFGVARLGLVPDLGVGRVPA